MPTSSAMIITMFGRRCGGCACAPAGADSAIDISAVVPISAARSAVCRLTDPCRRPSRLESGTPLKLSLVMIPHSPLIDVPGTSPLDASKANVTGGRIDRLRVSRGRPIAAAIVRRAQMRAAFQNLPWDAYLWQAGIEAFVLASAAGIFRNAAGLRSVRFVSWRIPVGRPFPDIPDHVVDAVAVRRKGRDRRGAIEAVGTEILMREFALPGVGHMPVTRRELRAPGVFGVSQAAACRKLPFRFG